jgi:hypothetical protein
MEVIGQPHVLAALPQGQSPRYPLYKRLGGPRSRSELNESYSFIQPVA